MQHFHYNFIRSVQRNFRIRMSHKSSAPILLYAALHAMLYTVPATAQQASAPEAADSSPTPKAAEMNSELRSTYVLGSDDQIVIRALEAEDISEEPVRVDSEGYIRLPLSVGCTRPG